MKNVKWICILSFYMHVFSYTIHYCPRNEINTN